MYICVFLCNYFMIFSPDDLMKISNLTQRLMLASLFLWCLNLTQFNLNFWRFAVGFAWRITTWYLKPFPAVRTYMKYYMVVLRKKKKKKENDARYAQIASTRNRSYWFLYACRRKRVPRPCNSLLWPSLLANTQLHILLVPRFLNPLSIIIINGISIIRQNALPERMHT